MFCLSQRVKWNVQLYYIQISNTRNQHLKYFPMTKYSQQYESSNSMPPKPLDLQMKSFLISSHNSLTNSNINLPSLMNIDMHEPVSTSSSLSKSYLQTLTQHNISSPPSIPQEPLHLNLEINAELEAPNDSSIFIPLSLE